MIPIVGIGYSGFSSSQAAQVPRMCRQTLALSSHSGNLRNLRYLSNLRNFAAKGITTHISLNLTALPLTGNVSVLSDCFPSSEKLEVRSGGGGA